MKRMREPKKGSSSPTHVSENQDATRTPGSTSLIFASALDLCCWGGRCSDDKLVRRGLSGERSKKDLVGENTERGVCFFTSSCLRLEIKRERSATLRMRRWSISRCVSTRMGSNEPHNATFVVFLLNSSLQPCTVAHFQVSNSNIAGS